MNPWVLFGLAVLLIGLLWLLVAALAEGHVTATVEELPPLDELPMDMEYWP